MTKIKNILIVFCKFKSEKVKTQHSLSSERLLSMTGRIPSHLIVPGKTLVTCDGTQVHCSVRPTIEAFLQLLNNRDSGINPRKSEVVYDPFCGNGISLAIVAIYFRDRIKRIYGSDIDGQVQNVARKNVQFRTNANGLLEDMKRKNGAMGIHWETAIQLLQVLRDQNVFTPVPNGFFKANVLNSNCNTVAKNISDGSVSTIFMDPPYNHACPWRNGGKSTENDKGNLVDNLRASLVNLRSVLSDDGQVGILMKQKGQKAHRNMMRGIPNYEFQESVITDGLEQSGRVLHILNAT